MSFSNTVTTPSMRKFIKQITSNIKIPKYPPSCKFPADVLKYMKKNGNSRQAFKMMKVNKYFIQQSFSFTFVGDDTMLFKDGFCICGPKKTSYKIDQLPNYLCIHGTLRIHHQSLFPKFISKIIICDLKSLILRDLRISFDDLKFLTSDGKLKELHLRRTIVTSKNDEIISYEKLLELSAYLLSLTLTYDPATQFSRCFAEKICSSNLERLVLRNLADNFDFETFLNSVAKKKPKLDVQLYFEDTVNHQKINAYINKLVAAGLNNFYPPSFRFDFSSTMAERSTDKNFKALENLRKIYRQQNPGFSLIVNP